MSSKANFNGHNNRSTTNGSAPHHDTQVLAPYDPATVVRFLEMLQHGSVDGITEIRIFPKAVKIKVNGRATYVGKTVAGYYEPDQYAKAAEDIAPFDGKAQIYVTLNPVKRDLLARGANRLETAAERTTSDEDILCRLWLPVDADPVRPSGISATDWELQAARERSAGIAVEFESYGAQVVPGMSGNGGHTLVRLPDLPNTPETTKAVVDILKTLSDTYSDDVVDIDTNVSNAARIWKVYGTLATKGDNIEERPHRRAVIEFPETPPRPFDLSAFPLPEIEAPTPTHHHTNGSNTNGTSPNGAKYVAKVVESARAKVLAAGDGHRHNMRLKQATLLGGFIHTGHIDEASIMDALGDNFGPDEAKARQAILDGIKNGAAKPLEIPPLKPRAEYRAPQVPADEEASDIPVVTLGYPLTDTGNAERFISQFGENFLYSKALGFHIWNGTCWAPDETDKVCEWGKKTVRRIYFEAGQADDDDRPKIAAWAKTSESLPRRKALIETVSTDGPKIHPDKFDSNPWLFGVQNGTLDLQTGQLRAPDRADFITKSAPVIYDPSATCPRFIQFLSAVLKGDLETAEFLQRFFGYTLTGSTREQCFLILYGGGSNGKSTLLNVLRWLLGSYCKQTKPDTLMQKKFGDGIPNDVAMLRGARMATAIETNEGRQFDEAKIKEMTGGDPVSARFFRKEFFEFVPEFKLYLATNHKPRIIGDDAGIWRRVRLVPFDVHFWNPDKQGESGPEHLRADKTLGDALRDELPGILNWALEGCLNWQRDGLPEPKSVADATAEYRTESDPLETFLSERCFCAEHCETPNAQLYKEFSEWAQREDENELSQKAFTARMRLKGFENTRGTGGLRKWKGVGLVDMGAR
jgi:P4 family phage/plasmid primase-like protien